MSYRCTKCNEVHEGSELRHVAEIRTVRYDRNYLRFDRRDNVKKPVFDNSFHGTEIVKIDKLCSKCYEQVKDIEPRISNKEKVVSFVGIKHKKTVKTDGEDIDDREPKEKFERN